MLAFQMIYNILFFFFSLPVSVTFSSKNTHSSIIRNYDYIKIKSKIPLRSQKRETSGPVDLLVCLKETLLSECVCHDRQCLLQGSTLERLLSILDKNNQWQLLLSWAVDLFLSDGLYEPCKPESLETTYVHLCKQGYESMWHLIVPLKNLVILYFVYSNKLA